MLLRGFRRGPIQEVKRQEHRCDHGKHEQASLGTELSASEPVRALERGGQQAVWGEPSAVGPGVDKDSREIERGVEPDGESQIAGAAKRQAKE